MLFEVLSGLPPYGPPALSFTEAGPREWREGLVVRFHPKTTESWVGNFLGGQTKCNTVLSHPNERDVIVVANGEAFVVEPERRTLRERFGGDIEEVFPLSSPRVVLFQCMTDFCAVRADNSSWNSLRISWDGLRNVKVEGTKLTGEAYTPIENAWFPFELDLLTGNCAGAIYQAQRPLFIPIEVRKPDSA